MTDTERDILVLLCVANQFSHATWKCWVYSAKADALVLCAYRPAFTLIGYLVFREPRYLCLPSILQGATFGIETGLPDGLKSHLGGDSPIPYCTIAIHSEDRHFRIVCKDVAFYPGTTMGDSDGS